MEADTPPPAFEYFYVGQGADDFCRGGYGDVLTAMEMKRGWITKGAPDAPGAKSWRSGPLGYATVLKDQPAYPAVVVYYKTPDGWAVSNACGYGNEKAFRVMMALSGVGADAIGVYHPAK